MATHLKKLMTIYWLMLAFLFPSSLIQAANMATRLHEDDGQYSGFPDSYPVCKSKMDYMHYDGTPTLAKRNLFETKLGWIEVGVYAVGVQFDGTEVVKLAGDRLRLVSRLEQARGPLRIAGIIREADPLRLLPVQ